MYSGPRGGTMLGVDACEFGGQVLELLWLTMCYRGLLTGREDFSNDEEEEETKKERPPKYTHPVFKTLQDIRATDKEDESLIKYKQTLLGLEELTEDPSEPHVRVTTMALVCDQAPVKEVGMDLTGDLNALKEQCFTLQEGAEFKLKLHFKVNREIVAGLRYNHVMSRKGIKVDRVSYMVGSYGPTAEVHESLSPINAAPKGLMTRGRYQISSSLIDDDKNVHLNWEWNLDVKKDWDD